MNKLDLIASVFIGIGVTIAYHSGRRDAIKEMKAAEAKRWEEAARSEEIDNSEREPIP